MISTCTANTTRDSPHMRRGISCTMCLSTNIYKCLQVSAFELNNHQKCQNEPFVAAYFLQTQCRQLRCHGQRHDLFINWEDAVHLHATCSGLIFNRGLCTQGLTHLAILCLPAAPISARHILSCLLLAALGCRWHGHDAVDQIRCLRIPKRCTKLHGTWALWRGGSQFKATRKRQNDYFACGNAVRGRKSCQNSRFDSGTLVGARHSA